MNRRHTLSIFVSFVAGIVVAVFVPRLIRGAAESVIFPEHRTEVTRVSSPDGTLDAVAERIDCGAPCSSAYTVSIVRRGATAPRNPTQQVFLADDIVNPQVRWKEPHLLDIAYDKAFIHNFHNVAYPLGQPGDAESWRYAVEIRLSPSSWYSNLADGNQAKVSH